MSSSQPNQHNGHYLRRSRSLSRLPSQGPPVAKHGRSGSFSMLPVEDDDRSSTLNEVNAVLGEIHVCKEGVRKMSEANSSLEASGQTLRDALYAEKDNLIAREQLEQEIQARRRKQIELEDQYEALLAEKERLEALLAAANHPHRDPANE